MSKACCVCNEPKESKDNVIFTCKGQGCDVSVHQGCYGIVTVPSGQWFCRKCESQERAARVRCELCPRKEGALKRTDSGGWAHVACALYIPEVVFGNNRIMEPIITSKLPRERFSKSCYICEERGNETQATYGACMSCHKPSCRQAFHVTCAQRERLLCEEEDPRDSRNVIYCGYCSTHHKKMMRQKLKQTHKPLFTPPTSGSLYPATPTSTSPSSTTPLSSLSDLAPAEVGMVRDGRKLERTRSGSPHKLNIKQERQSLSELPMKRSSTDSSTATKPPKKRKRKPSSSNESTTSEAPSNSSDFSLIPSTMVIPTSSPRLAPGIPLSVASSAGRGDGGRGQKGRVVGQHEEMLEMAQTGEMGVDGERKGTGSSTAEHNSRIQAPPPRSLQELLERQWEQTAQFILDQAGKQNNAGSMLAHLHTLQSENRQMQSRIMELASQREFYIAINTKLRQTLTEHDLGHLPNGVQPVGNGLQQMVVGEAELIAPMDVGEHHKPHASRCDHAHNQVQLSRELESAPPPPHHGFVGHAIQRADQEGPGTHARYSPSSSTGARPASDAASTNAKDPKDAATSTSSQHHRRGAAATSSHLGSNFVPTLTRVPSTQYPPLDATPLPHAPPHQVMEYAAQQDSAAATATIHEVTQVTNSLHAPISSLTPLPNDVGEAYGGGVVSMTTPTPFKKELNRR